MSQRTHASGAAKRKARASREQSAVFRNAKITDLFELSSKKTFAEAVYCRNETQRHPAKHRQMTTTQITRKHQ